MGVLRPGVPAQGAVVSAPPSRSAERASASVWWLFGSCRVGKFRFDR